MRRRRSQFAVTQQRVTTLIAMSSILTDDATDIEMPNPVAIATYTAMHAGHFGIKASTALGISH